MENFKEITPVPKTKICRTCELTKPLQDFSLDKYGKFGRNRQCRVCNKKYYYANKQKINNRVKLYYEINKNKEKFREAKKAYYKKYSTINRKKLSKLYTKRLKSDLTFKIAHRLRGRIHQALEGRSKNKKTLDLLGCSADNLKTYLQSKFQQGMTWENYGLRGWHVDHIRPCASFDLSKPEEQAKCFHYTNLQPLWWQENLSKGCKVLNNPPVEFPQISATLDVPVCSTTE